MQRVAVKHSNGGDKIRSHNRRTLPSRNVHIKRKYVDPSRRRRDGK